MTKDISGTIVNVLETATASGGWIGYQRLKNQVYEQLTGIHVNTPRLSDRVFAAAYSRALRRLEDRGAIDVKYHMGAQGYYTGQASQVRISREGVNEDHV